MVDDDGVILELLRTVLADEGHTPLVFAKLDEVPPDTRADVVITDLVPLSSYRGDDARSWIASLRARFGRVPLIVVTAHSAALDEPDSLGADAVVGKPFDLEALLAKVTELSTTS